MPCYFGSLSTCGDSCTDDCKLQLLINCTENDVNIILTESGLLPSKFDLSTMQICPFHFNDVLRQNLNRTKRNLCQVPSVLNAHPGNTNHRKSRLIRLNDVEAIHNRTGIVLPIGTPICTKCLVKVHELTEGENRNDNLESKKNTKCSASDNNGTFAIGGSSYNLRNTTFQNGQHITPDVMQQEDEWSTIYTLSQETFSSQASYQRDDALQHLCKFLDVCGANSVLHLPEKLWLEYSERRQNDYLDKIDSILNCIINCLFPDANGAVRDRLLQRNVNESDENSSKETPSPEMLTVAEWYDKTESWNQKRQLLSLISLFMTYKQSTALIPNLTEYKYYTAKKHGEMYGHGLPAPTVEVHRQKMDPVKLDSFLDFITSQHIVKDLPFGERKITLSNGVVQNMPNIIRCMGSAEIIQQYKTYCQENSISPLGDSTMYRILSECSATVRKSLEGLDYFVAEGGRAISNIQKIIAELHTDKKISDEELKHYNDVLLHSKKYLKSDYKVHISESSQVAEHCRTFSLSDERNLEFKQACQHEHDQLCTNCEQIHELLRGVNSLLKDLDHGEKEAEYVFILTQAEQSIRSWKKHILRSRNQESAKTKLLNDMKEDEVLIILDWAMKYLPRRYREDQSNWFAKRGISWHISVAFRNDEENTLQSLAFVHIFEGQISQDAKTTTAIILDTVKTLKRDNPNTNKVHLYSDNAGCYKSVDTINGLFNSDLITSYDFCEAQDGKGACDRTAATIKSAVRRYVNQGNDVMTASQLKQAIDVSTKNVKYRVKVVSEVECGTIQQIKTAIPGISALNNITFEENGIRMWKAYGIGPGKYLAMESNIAPLLSIKEESEGISFHSLQHAKRKSSDVASESCEGIFHCQNENCDASFPTYEMFEAHTIVGECQQSFRHRSSTDVLKTAYFEKIHTESLKQVTMECESVTASEKSSNCSQGWAIKEDRKNKKFNENQKSYLIEKFNRGAVTGKKEDPEKLSEEMRREKTSDGRRRFSLDEYLTPLQITSFFSRYYKKQSAVQEQIISNLEQDLLS